MVISDLKGKTINFILNLGNVLYFELDDGVVKIFHDQSCCETVQLEETHGDLDWLLHSPILHANMTQNEQQEENGERRSLWTFYDISTIKGTVVFRWLGESNGYYSEEVDLDLIGLNNADYRLEKEIFLKKTVKELLK